MTHIRQFIEKFCAPNFGVYPDHLYDLWEKELLEAVEKDGKFSALVDNQIIKEAIGVLEEVQTAYHNINPNDTVQSLTSEMEWMSRDAKIVLDKIK